MKCPQCKGRKYIIHHDKLFGIHVRWVCPTCKGEGSLTIKEPA